MSGPIAQPATEIRSTDSWAHSLTDRVRAAAWPALALGLALLALALFKLPTQDWDWQPALIRQQPWRAWTAAAVHWTPAHLHMNLAGCAVLAWLGWRAELGPRETLAWALAWPLTQVGLLLQPALLHYGGLSGVLHAGVVLVAWGLASQSGRNRWLGLLMASGLLAKLVSERPWRAELQSVPGYDFQVAPMAHSTGALAGLLCGALVLGGCRWQDRRAAARALRTTQATQTLQARQPSQTTKTARPAQE